MSSIGGHVQCVTKYTSRSNASSGKQKSVDLTKRLCRVSQPSSARNPANKTCFVTEMGESVMVLFDAVMRKEIKSCRQIVDRGRSWKENVGCALLTFTILRVQALMKHLLSGPELHNVVDMLRSSHSLTAKVHHSRSIIENCNLKQVSSELYRGNSSGPN
eukprot:scpid103809/ scgid10571/ 